MGGNVFGYKSSEIKLENITPTLTEYFEELKKVFPNKSEIFNESHFFRLGSVGKKPTSGDIDLGIDITSLLDSNLSDRSITMWGICPTDVEIEFASLKKRARTSTDYQLRLKAFLKLLTKYINTSDIGSLIYFEEAKVTPGNVFSLYPQVEPSGNQCVESVQIDWMIGDRPWLEFSYYSEAYPIESNAKGLHRTQLLLSAFQVADMSFSHTHGVKNKSTNQVVATDPESALAELGKALNVEISREVSNDFYKLLAILGNGMSKSDYSQMIDTYFKILDSTRADIPDILQNTWLGRKKELGLTGKFLPETSALR